MAAAGGAGVVVGVSRSLCTVPALQNGGRSRIWLHGWVGMVERHDRPNPST
jgi:hypothetical protein